MTMKKLQHLSFASIVFLVVMCYGSSSTVASLISVYNVYYTTTMTSILRKYLCLLITFLHIPPLQELSYDYDYDLNNIIGADGQIKKLGYYCGAAACQKCVY
ncbi:hypothetical protein DM860_001071 [Cuscuta australis]|uniref:Uncharacterized protein n=1 Tax=Cuscuta australis TaxID=267555 RepID=A0A328DX43_9ASTE|nr:hypothetical protein DM860_001071 [Cuscuta australis]